MKAKVVFQARGRVGTWGRQAVRVVAAAAIVVCALSLVLSRSLSADFIWATCAVTVVLLFIAAMFEVDWN